MVKYRILWEALKETAEELAAIEPLDDLRWSTLLEMMKDGEKMFESGELSNGTVLSTVVKALVFSFVCLGEIVLVKIVIGG